MRVWTHRPPPPPAAPDTPHVRPVNGREGAPRHPHVRHQRGHDAGSCGGLGVNRRKHAGRRARGRPAEENPRDHARAPRCRRRRQQPCQHAGRHMQGGYGVDAQGVRGEDGGGGKGGRSVDRGGGRVRRGRARRRAVGPRVHGGARPQGEAQVEGVRLVWCVCVCGGGSEGGKGRTTTLFSPPLSPLTHTPWSPARVQSRDRTALSTMRRRRWRPGRPPRRASQRGAASRKVEARETYPSAACCLVLPRRPSREHTKRHNKERERRASRVVSRQCDRFSCSFTHPNHCFPPLTPPAPAHAVP